MTVRGQLRRMLETVADALGADLRERFVFVGGCTTALFITDPITLEDVRATDDVDLIVDLMGYGAWARMKEQLRGRGFSASPDDDVICRMRLGSLKVDFMPDDETIPGFSNRWYAKGIETSVVEPLTARLEIRRLTPPLIVATKLEAYRGRGNDDPSRATTWRMSCSSWTGGKSSPPRCGRRTKTSAASLPGNSARSSAIPISIPFWKATSGGRKDALKSFAAVSMSWRVATTPTEIGMAWTQRTWTAGARATATR